MIPRIRTAAGAAVLLSLAVLVAGCGHKNPGGATPTGPGQTNASAGTSTTPAATPTASTGGGQQVPAAGTVLLLDHSGSQNGIYDLRDGQVSLWYADNTFAFEQSAVVSPQGTRIAFIGSNDAEQGQLRVISGGGTATDLGPDTLTNTSLPLWAPDGGSVLALDGNGTWLRIAVPSGTVTPVSAPNGSHIGKFSPDLGYVLMSNESGTVMAHVDGTAATPVVAPAGKKLHRVLSLSPNGHDIIADVEAPDYPGGDPARPFFANAIVDTRTGTVLPVPGGGTLQAGHYLANGDAILRVTQGGAEKVLLVSPTGTVVSQQTVPASAAGYALIGYVAAA